MYYKIIQSEDEDGKIIEDKIYYTDSPLNIGGFCVYNPTKEQIEAEGYVWEDIENTQEEIPTIDKRISILENENKILMEVIDHILMGGVVNG